MPQYQYINKAGQPGFYDAADDASASTAFQALTDRDPHSGYMTAAATPALPGAPSAPPARDYRNLARNAGSAGLSMSDYSSLLGPTPEEERAAKDKIAKQFGYGSADEFFTDAFRKPSKTTEQFYRSAYSAAGLPNYITNISKKREALAKALNTVNDNPWLDEASRSGKAKRLQELAYADIGTLENEYKLRLEHVRDLVGTYSDDLGQDEKIREARLKYLENAVKDATTASAKNRALDNLTDYLEGRQSSEAEAPKTVSVPGTSNLYQYDNTTGGWKLIQKARPPARKGSGSGSDENKILTAFTSALTSRTEINKAGTREQFIRQLQAKFSPAIDAGDIARKVYETYPDGYDAAKTTPKPEDPLDKYNE